MCFKSPTMQRCSVSLFWSQSNIQSETVLEITDRGYEVALLNGCTALEAPSDRRLRFNIPGFDLGASRALNTIWGGREKQAWGNYGRTNFSWLPVIENKLQIGWWHGISDINNVSSDRVTALFELTRKSHTLPRQWNIQRVLVFFLKEDLFLKLWKILSSGHKSCNNM